MGVVMPRRKLVIRCVAGCTGTIIVVALWLALPPSFNFRFHGEQLQRDDVMHLVALASDLRHDQTFSPPWLEEEHIFALAKWILDKGNAEAKFLRELQVLAADESDLKDPNVAKFRMINSQISALKDCGELDYLRGLPEAEIVEVLKSKLSQICLQQIELSWRKHLSSPDNRALLKRMNCPDFPRFPNPVRATLAIATGWRLSDRERWVNSFLQAVDRDLRTVADHYRSIDRQNTVPFMLAGGGQLYLKKRDTDVIAIPSTVYSGLRSTTDFDVLWVPAQEGSKDSADSNKASRIIDTGIRFICLPWQPSDGKSKQIESTPVWPPSGENVEHNLERVGSFLKELGIYAPVRFATVVAYRINRPDRSQFGGECFVRRLS